MHIQACPCSVLRSLLLAAVLLVPATSIAGPPLLCHPFDTGGAASLPWGDGWNRMTGLHLYHIIAALNRVGLGAEARMIAAEAVARG